MTPPLPPAPPLSSDERALGRRLAITSHPAGMTFWMVFNQHLPTLLLVSMGASETQVGMQQSFLPGTQALQLPTLRAIARVSKRRILVLGQVVALVVAIPIVFIGSLAKLGELDSDYAILAVLVSFALVAASLNAGNTAWFPLLRSYVEPGRIGHFFGLLRSSWHLALIVYYLGAQVWLTQRPGDFAPLFAAAWLFGLIRIALIARLPERSERSESPIRVREAFALLRARPELRSYLLGVSSSAGLRTCALTFAIVMLRREVGFSDAHLILATLASYGGGLASLYLWGRITDRVGAAPVFRATSLALSALLFLLPLVDSASSTGLAIALFFFFGHAVLSSGFGVADTQVLFDLAPDEAPARTLVIAGVATSSVAALAPVIAGLAIESLLGATEDALAVYRGFFVTLAILQAIVFVPLRGFRRPASLSEEASQWVVEPC